MQQRTDHRRRWSGVSLAVLATIAAGSLVGAVTVSPPSAAAATSFTALAAAEGIRVSPYAGGAPVANEPFELGLPVAQATFDSLGTSQSFSSAVYPGDLLVSLPGLIAGVSGGQLNLPNYPLIAISDQETAPEKEVAAPGVTMRATSDASGAEATTTLGNVTTTASISSELDGSVISESESVLVGLATDLLKIGNLRSTARVVLSADGTVSRASTFEVSGLEVAGVKVAVTREGFVFGDQGAPLPSAKDLQPALAQAGIDLRLLGAVETPDGIDGQGLEIVISRDIGGAVTPVRLRLRFGRVAASVGRTGSDLVTAPLPAPEGAPAQSTAPAPTPAEPVTSSAPAPAAGDPVPAAAVAEAPRRSALVPTKTSSAVLSRLPVVLPDVSPAPPVPAPVTAPAEAPAEVAAPVSDEPESQASRFRLAGTETSPFDTRGLYLVLAAVAAMAGAGVFLVARFGVRI